MVFYREIEIKCEINSPDDGFYSFLVDGKIFHAESYDKMVDYLREKYPVNGVVNKISLNTNGLSEELKEDVDLLKQGLEWKLNQRRETQLI